MFVLYSFILLLALILSSPWWLLRMATSGKYREGLTERLGRIPSRVRVGLIGQAVVWVHAVSVGEVLAASRLIEELTRQLAGSAAPGGQQWRVVISTTTRTGQKLARERFGADRVFYFPLDFAWAVRSWLRALRPRILVLLETEFWPRMLIECRRIGIPVAVVNARISDRSWPRYRRLAWLWRHLLGSLTTVLAQSELDAQRLRALGAANVHVGGNLKYDVRAPKPAAIVPLLQEHLPQEVPVLVCGSTLPGEEELLLDALPPDVITILAPRHPERFSDVAQILRKRNAPWVRRTEWANNPAQIEPGTIVLLDSIGELASVYGLAHAAFVGGSLVQAGGHNPLEPAQFGIPVLMGPSYENFRSIVDLLRDQRAIYIVQAASLSSVLAAVVAGDPEMRAMGKRGQEVFATESGATQRALEALLDVLGETA